MAVKLPQYLFWWEWVKKMIWDPFWWLILFLIILWAPFLRVWWWVFLPIMLALQLKTLYLWYLNWDFDYAKMKWVFLEITPPKEVLMPYKAMEDVFSAIWPLMDVGNFRERWCDGELPYGPFWCSWEIASIVGKIHFYIRFLQQHRASIESALFGHYPDIEIHEVQDYTKLVPPTVPNEEWDMYGEDWDLGLDDVYPMKTYEKFFEPQGERITAEEKRMDPILSLLEAMSKLGRGEHYWVQFITIPVGTDNDEPDFLKDGKKLVEKIALRPEKKEPTLMEDLAYVARQVISGPEKEGSGESAKYSWELDEETGERQISLTPGEREIITEIDNKLKKPIFRTSIRGVYVAKRENWVASNRVITRTYMGHFNTANLNHWRFQAKTRPRVHFFMRKRRVFLRARKMFRMAVLRFPPLFPDRKQLCPLLNSEELATLYHFPIRTSGMVAPTMTSVESKKGGPPPNLPIDE
ncbi:MAG: hypothetical protein NT026_00275 [Candidatus Staskawiczbacteria bacterium]|nr:hypothetical protein [Candidatus Staskawiczbacteria bacterium]